MNWIQDRVSFVCARSRHARCTGRITVPNFSQPERREGFYSQTLRCECPICKHPEVPEAERKVKH